MSILSMLKEEESKPHEGGFLDNPLVKLAIGAGTGYLAGGLLPAIIEGLPAATPVAGPVTAAQAAKGITALPGVGGGVMGALAPRSETLLPAVEGAIKGLEAKSPEEAIGGGLKEAALPTLQSGKMKAFEKIGLTPSSVKVGDTTYGLSLPKQSEEMNKALKVKAPSGYEMAPFSYGGKMGIKPVKLPTTKTTKSTSMSNKAATVYQAAQARANKGEDINAIVADVNATTSITEAEKAKINTKLRGSKKPGITLNTSGVL